MEQLNYWLSRFVVEVQCVDQQLYPPTSIANILAGLYRYTKALDPQCPNFVNRKEVDFRVRELNDAINVRYRELRQKSIEAVVHHATVVEESEEEALCDNGVLGDRNLLALQRTVFSFTLVKRFV